jgi:hypothetical protein
VGSGVALVVAFVVATSACSGDSRPAPLDPDELVGAWVDEDGVAVPDGVTPVDGEFPLVFHVQPGPAHCGWQDALLLSLALPIGEPVVRFDERARQYVRDPAGVVSAELQGRLDLDARLTDGAEFAGLSRGDVELWIDPAHVDEFVFLTDGDAVERWPRSDPPTLCA